jgi:poly-gamma-glutamate synthesis protein (capsule biosynthesis protein)
VGDDPGAPADTADAAETDGEATVAVVASDVGDVGGAEDEPDREAPGDVGGEATVTVVAGDVGGAEDEAEAEAPAGGVDGSATVTVVASDDGAGEAGESGDSGDAGEGEPGAGEGGGGSGDAGDGDVAQQVAVAESEPDEEDDGGSRRNGTEAAVAAGRAAAAGVGRAAVAAGSGARRAGLAAGSGARRAGVAAGTGVRRLGTAAATAASTAATNRRAARTEGGGRKRDRSLGERLVRLVVVAFLLLFLVGVFVGDDEAATGSAAAGEGHPPGVVRPPKPDFSTTTAPPVRTFSVVAAGDVLLHSQLWRQAEEDAAAAGREGRSFAAIMAPIAPIVSEADLAVCHMETPLAAPEGPFRGYPAFSVPPEIAPALKATGFDACSTASNHTFDQGAEGVDRTLNTLDAAGLGHAGSARTPGEAGSTTMLNANGVPVALLSYTYGFNGIPAPNGEDWRANLIDEARILADAATAKQRGAEVVIVALHWGNEYGQELSAQQADMAPRLIRSPDIDLIWGHHAHVTQAVENIDGEWVVYGMGNMVAYQGTLGATREEGLMVRFTFSDAGGAWKVTDAAYEPLLTARQSPTRVVPVGRALHDPATPPEARGRLQEAWDRTVEIVGSRGGGLVGLHPLTG